MMGEKRTCLHVKYQSSFRVHALQNLHEPTAFMMQRALNLEAGHHQWFRVSRSCSARNYSTLASSLVLLGIHVLTCKVIKNRAKTLATQKSCDVIYVTKLSSCE